MLSQKEVRQKLEKIISNLNKLTEPASETNMFKVFADFATNYAVLQLKNLLREIEEEK